MAGGVKGAARSSEAARRPPSSGSVPVGPTVMGLGDGPIGRPSPSPNGLTGTARFPASKLGVGGAWGSCRWCAVVA